jgi:hypothetical protein
MADWPPVGLRSLARLAGLIGGLCWLAAAALDGANASDSLVNAVHWGGLALIAIALVGIGFGLVNTRVWWLAVIVGICLPALVWAVLEWAHEQWADRYVDGTFGVLLAIYCLVGLASGSRSPRVGNGGEHSSVGVEKG